MPGTQGPRENLFSWPLQGPGLPSLFASRETGSTGETEPEKPGQNYVGGGAGEIRSDPFPRAVRFLVLAS
jgi:hypothetical protein